VSRSPRSAARSPGSAATRLGQGGLGLHDRVLERGARVAPQHVGALAGEQLEQDDAEAVDVGRGRDRRAEDLLGRRVLGRQRPAGLLRELGLVGDALVEQLGDAEVEQAHLGVLGDEDVAGLEVAMHHQVGVRMPDRARDLQEQAQPPGQVELAALAPAVDALALHQLDREIGLAVGRQPGVVEPGDVRMVQGGQDLALARQPLGQPGPAPVAVGQLQRDLAALQHVGALGQPHGRHAAFAEQAQQPVGTDPLRPLVADRAVRRVQGEVGGLDPRQGRQRFLQRGTVGMRQQRAQARQQLGVLGTEPGQPGVARVGRQVEGLVEQLPQARPPFRREVEVAAGAHARPPRSKAPTSAPRRGRAAPAPSRGARSGRSRPGPPPSRAR
jgi:hypothetical protein